MSTLNRMERITREIVCMVFAYGAAVWFSTTLLAAVAPAIRSSAEAVAEIAGAASFFALVIMLMPVLDHVLQKDNEPHGME